MKEKLSLNSLQFDCCACGLCVSICPQKAVSLRSTATGRLFAWADDSLCSLCSLCTSLCPVAPVSANEETGGIAPAQSCYLCRAADPLIYREGQSGGSCTAVLSHLLKSGTVQAVLLCRQEPGPKAGAVVVTKAEDLLSCQKSFYMQVSLLEDLSLIKEYSSVAVVGLPCHLKALGNLRQRFPQKYGNIKILLGLVCDRTLCGAAADVFGRLTGMQDYSLQWRSRAKGPYNNAPLLFTSKEGKEKVRENLYRLALKETLTPPCCQQCTDKLNSSADIVFADPWGMSGADMKHGENLVFTHTAGGAELLQQCLENGVLCNAREASFEKVKAAQLKGKKQDTESFRKLESLCKEEITNFAYNAMMRQVRLWRWKRSLTGKIIGRLRKTVLWKK